MCLNFQKHPRGITLMGVGGERRGSTLILMSAEKELSSCQLAILVYWSTSHRAARSPGAAAPGDGVLLQAAHPSQHPVLLKSINTLKNKD